MKPPRLCFWVLFFAFFITPLSFADSGYFSPKIQNKNQIDLTNGKTSRKILLAHEVYGYEVNCARTRMILWGKPQAFNRNNPQDSMLTIVRLDSRQKPIRIGFGKNIFDATFINNGQHAKIETDTETFVDLESGNIISPPNDVGAGKNLEPELCSDFPNKSFRKFTNQQ